MSRAFDPDRLDVRRFAEDGGVLEGAPPLSSFERLLAETQGRGADTPVAWQATGELRNPRHIQPEIRLHLKAGARLSLTCQRCLQPVEMPVAVDRDFLFVDDEAAAAALDDDSEEDVLVTSRAFDLPSLVEDELIMALPLAPHHETCPPISLTVADPGFDAAQDEPRENPFAQLGKLKPGGGGA